MDSKKVDHVLIHCDDPIVGGHRLSGQCLFPGLAYIDLICQLFVEDGVELDRIGIRNFAIFGPLIVDEHRSVELKIVRSPSESGPIIVSIDGQDFDRGKACSQRRKLASLEVDTSGKAFPEVRPVDLRALRSSARHAYDIEVCYERCRRLGLEHSGAMRSTGRIYETDEYIVIDIELNGEARESASEFLCHPALIDASAIGSGNLFGSDGEDSQQLFLPLHFQGFSTAARFGTRCSALIERRSQSRIKELTRQTIQFFTDDGRPVAVLDGYTNKLLRGGRLNAAVVSESADASSRSSSWLERITELFADELQRPVSRMDHHLGYYELGASSMALLSISQKLQTWLGRELSPTLLFEYTTIAELVEYLVTLEVPPERTRESPPAKPVSVPTSDCSAAHQQPEIAVIGLAGRYPEAENVDVFWSNLIVGKDCIREVPRDRWYSSELAHHRSPSGKSMSRWGGFLADVDRFDPLFFNISPRDAELMDPQERLFLQTCWEAIEDAGYTPKTLVRSRGPRRRNVVGVFVGVMHNDYALLGWEAVRDGAPMPLAINQAPLANRVSFVLNFHGPSLVVDTVCSSSLTAVHLAIESLRRGECEVALAGGVNLSLHPSKYLTYGLMDMHSSDGRCRSFGAGGDGYVSAEGVGTVLLKPLAKAVADGDRIYAVLKGSSINHGGKASGFTVPNPTAHADMIVDCLEKSGVDARTISYVEAHGTGTSLGDPIEVQGLTKAFEHFTKDLQFCAIGSVKSLIGHAESAAGISGLTKVILQLHHRRLVPSLHAAEGNPHIDLTKTPFFLQKDATAWRPPIDRADSESGGARRRAALSSFGAYGSNAHVIVEEYVPAQPLVEVSSNELRPVVIVLSARTAERLSVYASDLLEFLRRPRPDIGTGTLRLVDVAHTLQVGRQAMEVRVGFIVQSMEQLLDRLSGFVARKDRGDGRDAQLNGRLAHALSEWLDGRDVDWDLLSDGVRGQRIALPTYPFARERYWIPQTSKAERWSALVFQPQWKAEREPDHGPDLGALRHEVVFLPGPATEPGFQRSLATARPDFGIETLRGTDDDPAARYAEYCRCVFDKIRSELAQTTGRILLQIVSSDPRMHWVAQGLVAILETARRENPRIITQLLMLEKGPTPESCLSVIAAGRTQPKEVAIRQHDGERELLRWLKVDELPDARSPWRDGGVYLVTGGAGGLGKIVAQEIMGAVQNAVIVLAGRSVMDVKLEELVRCMSANGARVVYRSFDVADASEVRTAVEAILEEFGALHGVLHCAGIHRDAFLVAKEWSEFATVLAPKVQGTVNLDLATRGIALDCFVLFSSIAGALGSVGQVDYAAANAFMAGFAEHRGELCRRGERFGKTIAIDWPLWSEGGMTVDTETLETMRATFGMVPMATASGLAALRGIVELAEAPRYLVVEGEAEVIERVVTQRAELPVFARARSRAAVSAGDDVHLEHLQALVSARLKSLIGEAVKLPASEIDGAALFERYGIDSLVIKRVNRALDDVFDGLPKTLFFEHDSVDALAKYLVDAHDEQARIWCGRTEALAAVVETVEESIATVRCEPGPRVSLVPSSVLEPGQREPIAIIGISGRYPQAPDLDAFWHNLADGRDCISEIPEERWSLHDFFHADPDEAVSKGGSYGKWGGFLDGFADFDPLFFGIAPRDALAIDPQERIFLQTSWHALEDAGYTRARLQDRHRGKVGVFAGVTKAGFNLWAREGHDGGPLVQPRTSFSSVANRVSYFLDLCGPSMPIDTMCSSSLTAIHEACEQLARGACELALAGGVNLYLHPSTYAELSSLRMLSVDGKCRSFGAGGSGFVPGEGVGVVVLKPLSAALRDADRIHAVIRGSHINHGGKTNGYTVPNPQAQAEVIESALRNANVDARSISYVEAHGTGTRLGDPIEVRGLTQAFGPCTDDEQFCLLGSAKSNIGHLEAAAGIAGLTKVVLQMRHGSVAPTLHAENVNPNIELAHTPFELARTLTKWAPQATGAGSSPLRAGVSSFGAGGANAHVIVEAFDDSLADAVHARFDESRPSMIVVSARTKAQLAEQVRNLAHWVRRRLELVPSDAVRAPRLCDVAYTLQVGREPMDERLGLLVGTFEELQSSLWAVLEEDVSEDGSLTFRGDVKKNRELVSVLSRDDDAATLATSWYQRGKYGKILQLWVQGMRVDWADFYTDEPRLDIVSLPNYPFARQKFWIGGAEAKLPRNLGQDGLVANHAAARVPDPTSKPRGLRLSASSWTNSEGDNRHPYRFARISNSTARQSAAAPAQLQAGLDALDARLAGCGDAMYIRLELNGLEVGGSREAMDRLGALIRRIVDAPVPVVAVLDGTVSSAGFLLALCSDLLIAADTCRIAYDPVHVSGSVEVARQRALLLHRFGEEAARGWTSLRGSSDSLKWSTLGLESIAAAQLPARLAELAEHLEAKERAALGHLKAHLGREIRSILYESSEAWHSSSPSDDRRIASDPDVVAFFSVNPGALVPEDAKFADEMGTGRVIALNSDVISMTASDDGTVLIQMHERDSKNTFSDDFVDGLLAAFAHVAASDAYKVVVLTGYHHYFACGGTKEGLRRIHDRSITYEDQPVYDLALQCDLPVIAAMQGHGLGVGWTMGMFADLPIFSRESVYVCAMMNYGFTPGGGSTFIFPHRLGKNLGDEVQFTGREYKGEELRRRIVGYPVLPRDRVLPYALAVAKRLGRASRAELMSAKARAVDTVRSRIGRVYELELAMHEKNFIGNGRVLERISSEFNSGFFERDMNEPKIQRKVERAPAVNLEVVKNFLRKVLAEELFLNTEDIDDDRPFMDLGLDSISSVNWGKRINSEYDLNLAATLVYQHPTLSQFAEFVVLELGKRVPKTANDDVRPPPAQQAAFVEPSLPVSKRPQEASKSLVGDEHGAIAVIGMSGRFPQADDTAELWRIVSEEVDAVTEIPSQRWTSEDVRAKQPEGSDADRYRWMGVLDDIDRFDPLYFNITPAEAATMDPQQRIFLEQAWACCEAAGYAPTAMSGRKCGVFVGAARNDYGVGHASMLSAQGLLGANSAVLAARIAYCLNLKGPALAIDTACSSSLVAIAEACNSLELGHCDAALAGGVWVSTTPDLHIMAADAGMLSPSGRCRTFDEEADGYVPGEGVGVVFLKRLADARREGDDVLAVIRGWGTNQDGKSNGLTAPHQEAQSSLQSEVYDRHGIDPGSIQLVEAHGTGTRLGDPIEVEALTQSFRSYTKRTGYCALGSVKSNIGHLLTAAGVASFIKVVLAIQHEIIPPTAQFNVLNRHINLDGTPFYVSTAAKPWAVEPGGTRRAAINSFGVSGTNAHLVVEQPEGALLRERVRDSEQVERLILLSARDRDSLRVYVRRILGALDQRRTISLRDLAYTLQIGREAHVERLAVVTRSIEDLRDKLQDFVLGRVIAVVVGRAAAAGGESNEVRARPADLEALARRWVQGVKIDWSPLHDGTKPSRVALPTPPFGGERYWLARESRSRVRPVPAAALHALIDEEHPSADGVAYAKRLHQTDFFLRDHVIAGEYVLPGVVHLEMALAAAELATGNHVIEICDVIWGRKVVVSEQGTQLLVRLSSKTGTVIEYQICAEREGVVTEFSQGTLRMAARRTKARRRIGTWSEGVRSRCRHRMPKRDVYSRLAAEGFDFGPTFRLTDELCCGETEALGMLSMPHDARLGSHTLHPAMLDAALRSFLGIVGPDGTDLDLRIPFSMESISINGPTPRVCHAHATMHRLGMDGELSSNISIVDEQGMEVISVRGLVAKPRAPRSVHARPDVPVVPHALKRDSHGWMKAYVEAKLAEVTKIPVEKLKADVGLEEYGIDSIIIMKLNRAFGEDFEDVPGTLFFEYRTIAALTGYFLEHHEARVLELLAGSIPPTEPTVKPVASAHVPVRRPRTDALAGDGIAIVGLSGRYPQADDLTTFWRNLLEGRDCIEEIPCERWDFRPWYSTKREQEGTIASKWGGFIDGVDEFDADFFGIARDDAAVMDPQVRLVLQSAWHAIEDAGYTPENFCSDPQRRVGVYVASMWNEYQLYGTKRQVVLSNNAFLANRVSYHFDFRGPSTVVDTGCSSSLHAIAMACASIRSGECTRALVGGVNLSLHPNKYLSLSRANLLAGDGRCRSYGKGGDGQVPGEGVGCVVLKPLHAAIRASDHVYGVIRAAVSNHGGKASGLMVPNLNAQADLVERAIVESGIDPQQIGYVEGHGTGSELGDPMEVRALTKGFERAGFEGPTCALGSVKSNIGHLEAMSGIVAITKVLLQFEHGQVVPSLHSSDLNPLIDFDRSPFRVVQQVEEWPRPTIGMAGHSVERPRTAAIGSFGAGGANAFAIVEEFVPEAGGDGPPRASSEPRILVWSARTQDALRSVVRQMVDWLESSNELDLADLAFTLQVGRQPMAERLGMVACSLDEVRATLAKFLADGVTGSELVRGSATNADAREPMQDFDLSPHQDARLAILRAWVGGHAFDWNRLYEDGAPQRISLPVYPFAKVRHWIHAEDETGEVLERVWRGDVSIDDAVALLSEAGAGPETVVH